MEEKGEQDEVCRLAIMAIARSSTDLPGYVYRKFASDVLTGSLDNVEPDCLRHEHHGFGN